MNARRDSFPLSQDTEWLGRLFECEVGAELCRRYEDVMYWREVGAEVDYVVKSHLGLLAIEVKSGRVKRMGGLERFCQRYQEAQPVVMDLEKGTQFLDGGDVNA